MITVGALTGLRREAGILARANGGPDLRLEIAVSGVYPDRARAEARRLMESAPSFLLSFGFAGGLSADLPAGSLVLPHAVVTGDGSVWPVDDSWRDAVAACLPVPVSGGLVAGVEATVATPAEKRALADRTGAVIADMESGVLAHAAAGRGMPVVVLRAVCDPANRHLPDAFLSLLDHRGRLRWSRLPSLLPHLGAALPLAIESGRAAHSLRVAADALPQLAAS